MKNILNYLGAISFLFFGPLTSIAQYSSELVAHAGFGYGNFSFVNEDIGYHFSQVGIYKTIDGGDTWEESINDIRMHIGCQGNYMRGHFVDEMNGWIVLRSFSEDYVKDTSFLYKTVDGGINWELKHINPPNDVPYGAAMFNHVYFKNLNEGWVFGNGLLEHTTDGGETWNTIIHHVGDLSNNDVLRGMCFTPEGVGYVVGYGSWILQSTDNGVTWNKQHFNGEYVQDDYFIYDVAFADEQLGYAAVGHGILKKTVDGGLNWEEVYTGLPDDNNGIALDASNTIWCAAGDYCDDTGCYNTNALLYSSDGGETWEVLYDGEWNKFTDVVWPSMEYGFACTETGMIYKIKREDVGIHDDGIDQKALYPNPATDIIYLDSSNEFKYATIVSLQGAVISRHQNSTITLGDLEKGIYWVNSYNEQGKLIHQEKLVKL